jgi:uncharacterized membrane protein
MRHDRATRSSSVDGKSVANDRMGGDNGSAFLPRAAPISWRREPAFHRCGGPTVAAHGHLWAIGFDGVARAAQVRDEVVRLGERHCLTVLDTAVAVRYPDGSVTLNGEPFVPAINVRSHTVAGFLAGLALGAPPLTGAAVGALLRGRGVTSDGVGIGEDFVSQVEALLKPGTSALFVLDQEGDMGALLRGIRGLGGTVLKTTVDPERAKLIQSTLAAAASDGR